MGILNGCLGCEGCKKHLGKYEIFHQYGTGFERKTARNDPEILNKAKKTGAGLISST